MEARTEKKQTQPDRGGGAADRIYGEITAISEANVKEFYDQRAKRLAELGPYTTVLLGDQRPEYAEQWNRFEKSFVLPRLKLGKRCRVLDIGCGVGRWAEEIAPLVGAYIGTDLSSGMIAAAAQRFRDVPNVRFINSSFQEIFREREICRFRYDSVIITGVLMYMCDDEIRKCMDGLSALLKEDAVVYVEESVGKRDGERLTLNHIWSENLKANYDAVYRTREEYLDLFSPLLEKTDVLEEDYLEGLDKQELSETSHWYAFLKKRRNKAVC